MLSFDICTKIAALNSSKQHFDRLASVAPHNVKHDSEELEQMIFAPEPSTGLPLSDICIMNKGGLSQDVLNVIMSLTMRHHSCSNNGFDSDDEAMKSAIPYQIDNESQLLQYYKAIGYDSEKIERVVNGESFESVFEADTAPSDDSSAE